MKGSSMSYAALDLNCSINDSITIRLPNQLSLRLYADSRPHCMETAAIQKGLVLMIDDEELIGEGIGFGVPVAKYKDKTYFSSCANVEILKGKSRSDFSLRKTFILDAVSRKKFRKSIYINDKFYSKAHKTFEKLYLPNKKLAKLFNLAMEFREVAQIKTSFEKVKPRGKVDVRYKIQSSTIKVSADFSDLSLEGCQKLLVLNEQGAKVFERYVDTSGLMLAGNEIGAWDPVAAKEAIMQNVKKQIEFSLNRSNEAALFRGWEQTKNRFSWAGLSYSLKPSIGMFEYFINLSCKDCEKNQTLTL